MITKLHMLVLMQPDFDAAVEFYKKLGFAQGVYREGNWVEFEIGGTMLGMCPADGEVEEQHVGVVLEVDDLKQFYEKNQQIFPTLSEPVFVGHGFVSTIQDPGGHLLDLYQPTMGQGMCSAIKKQCSEQEEACCLSKA